MHQRLLLPQKVDSPDVSSLKAAEMARISEKTCLNTRQYMFLSFLFLSMVTVVGCIFGALFNSCRSEVGLPSEKLELNEANGLEFLKGKRLLLVSHELSLTGGPLLLMELAVLLKNAGGAVKWVTNQKETDNTAVSQKLEAKLVANGIQICPARGSITIQAAHEADLIILNTAVAGKWIDSAFKGDVSAILPKMLWWIHEMRGHYFTVDLVKHLPNVGGAMIDSFSTAEYWKNRTQERLRIAMPRTYVVHLGNSRELMLASIDTLARKLMREHVREDLGLNDDDIIFAIINSVSRGKGQDLFLKSFYEGIQMLKGVFKHPELSVHALVVGSDMSADKYELELRDFVKKKQIEHLVHFVNKTMNVIPYLASIDVLVQNSQARGECFGRITIEAMAFQLPVLGTAAGGTREIVVNGTTGLLHPVGKDGINILAKHMLHLVLDNPKRIEMGKNGYQRVRDQFMENHMAQRIGNVLQEVLEQAKHHESNA